MAFTPALWQAQNTSLNCSFQDVQKLERQLGLLGIQVFKVVALPQGFASAGLVQSTWSDLSAAGAQPTDALFYTITIDSAPDARQFTAALVLADLAAGNENAVWKVMSDFYGGTGLDPQSKAFQAIVSVPGVQDALKVALTS